MYLNIMKKKLVKKILFILFIVGLAVFILLFQKNKKENVTKSSAEVSTTEVSTTKASSTSNSSSQESISEISQTESISSTQATQQQNSTLEIAQPEDLSGVFELDGTNGGAGTYYKVTITNNSQKNIQISTSDLSLTITSNATGSKNEPALYISTIELSAGESKTLNQLFGTFSGDTPYYNNISINYKTTSIYTQEAILEDYR